MLKRMISSKYARAALAMLTMAGCTVSSESQEDAAELEDLSAPDDALHTMTLGGPHRYMNPLDPPVWLPGGQLRIASAAEGFTHPGYSFTGTFVLQRKPASGGSWQNYGTWDTRSWNTGGVWISYVSRFSYAPVKGYCYRTHISAFGDNDYGYSTCF